MPENFPTLPVITGRELLPHLPRLQSDPLGFIMEITRSRGGLVHFNLGIIHAYLVCQPEAVKHILQDNHRNYSKDTLQYNALATVTGRGLLTSDGDLWLRNRRLEQPAFARPRLQALDAVVVPAVQTMLQRWQAAPGAELDLDAAMMELTLEVVGKALFGIDLSREAQTLTGAVLTCLDHIIYKARQQIVPPEWLPTPRNLRFRQALRTLDEAVYALIDARAGEPGGAAPGDDLLGMLLRARDPESGQGMSRRELRDEVITLLIAGHETVASALTWTFYLLAKHPQAWDMLRREVQTVLGGRPPGVADLPQLAFTGQVFDEALRLYPPAWLITRKALAADELGGQPVRAGALMIISPYAVHRQADVWPDPEVFDPGRFAPGEENRRHRYAYIPFGGGPRLCIGNQFALIEARLILAMVAQSFRLELSPSAQVVPDALVTIRPRGGLCMRLHALES